MQPGQEFWTKEIPRTTIRLVEFIGNNKWKVERICGPIPKGVDMIRWMMSFNPATEMDDDDIYENYESVPTKETSK
jgi:hypothetical protein